MSSLLIITVIKDAKVRLFEDLPTDIPHQCGPLAYMPCKKIFLKSRFFVKIP
jgi:hypothetical protein